MQKFRLITALLLLVTLIACGGQGENGGPAVGNINIEQFDARPLELGDGEWELYWTVTGAESISISNVDDDSLEQSGTSIVVAGTPTEYILTAADGDHTETDSLWLAPIGSPATITPSGPQDMTVGSTRQFELEFEAPGSDYEPSAAAEWVSLTWPDDPSRDPEPDNSIVTVDSDGLVTAVGEGRAIVRGHSAQWTGSFNEVFVTVTPRPVAGVSGFQLVDPDGGNWYAGEEIEVSWEAVGIERMQIRVTGGIARDVPPASIASYPLRLPTDTRNANAELIWTDTEGNNGTTELFPEPEPLPGWLCSDPDEVIEFADSAVERAVRALPYVNASSQTEPLTCGQVQPADRPPLDLDEEEDLVELSNVIVLNRCLGYGENEDNRVDRISSTEGLQHLTQLARLELECNNLTDIRFLRSMTGLIEINFDNNNISDLEPLTGLPNLEVVGLYNNDVSDPAPLSTLPRLRILYLSANHVSDVSSLAGLDQLELLWLLLNCEEIVYEDVHEELPHYGHNCLDDAGLSDSLTSLSNLQSLVLAANEVSDLEFLNGMVNLELVHVAGNNISDVSSLAGLPALRTAVLNENPIEDLGPLAASSTVGSNDPYQFERVNVGMSFPVHLQIGFNCLDDAASQLAALDAGNNAGQEILYEVTGEEENLELWCGTSAARIRTLDSVLRPDRLNRQPWHRPSD